MDMLLVAQTFSLLLPTLWLSTGVRDNILYPPVNEVFTAQVLTMQRMKEDYPDVMELHGKEVELRICLQNVMTYEAMRRVFQVTGMVQDIDGYETVCAGSDGDDNDKKPKHIGRDERGRWEAGRGM